MSLAATTLLVLVTVDASMVISPVVAVSTEPDTEDDETDKWLAAVTVLEGLARLDAANTFTQSPADTAPLYAFTVEAASAVMLPLVAAKVV